MECNATSTPIYTSRGEGVRTDYHSELEIHYSDDLFWKVHLGDVIALSVDDLTVKSIGEFQLNHYEKASPHWKIGLVTALTQVISPKAQTTHISIQYLEKILDTPFFNEGKIKGTYRPYRKNQNSQLPHVLVSTLEMDKITPRRVLPIQIQMLTHKEMFQNNGVAAEEEDSRHLKFHCPRSFQSDGTLVKMDPDPWVQFNDDDTHPAQATIPVPLQNAWKREESVSEIAALLPSLVKGFHRAVNEKRKERKRLEKLKRIQQENEQLEQEKIQQKRKSSSGQKSSHSGKRVRIQEPNEQLTMPAKPASLKKKKSILSKKKNAVKQVVKAAVTKAKRKISKTTTTKSKASSSDSTTTASTRSTSSSSRKSTTTTTTTATKKKKSNSNNKKTTTTKKRKKKVKPLGEVILRYQRKECYEKVQIPMDLDVFCQGVKPKRDVFGLSVGQVVAIRESADDDEENDRKNQPFEPEVKWSPAQVLSIYKSKDNGVWLVQVRWFFRCEELEGRQQEKVLADHQFSATRGIVESMKVDNIEVECVLPVHVQLTSQGNVRKSFTIHEDGLPTIHLSCRHLQTEKAEIVHIQTDWEQYHHENLESVPVPLERGISCLTKSLAAKYRDLITGQAADSTSSTSASTMAASSGISGSGRKGAAKSKPAAFEVFPLTTKPVYERWDRQFYDGVRLDIDKNSLVKSFHPKTQQWTIKVGYVVPIRMIKACLPATLTVKKKYWHPFVQPWSPGQIVSLYRSNETGEWMMQLRWFNRFADLLERQQEGLEYFDKPNVLFETEEYAHVSLSSVFPGRLIVTSNELDDWDIKNSFLTGLPLIPILCGHICLDEEIDCSTDWTNYDLKLKKLPSPLVRGLLLDPINRENKNWILMLGRAYKKSIQERGVDTDEQVLKQWSGREGRPLAMDDSVAFDPERVQISSGAEIFSTSTSPQLDFFRTFRFTVPVDYIATPSKLEMRSKKHRFSCKVGDVICFHDKCSVPAADYMLMKHIKHPWFPYRVQWSFGQILSMYRNEKTGALNVEVRRFLRISELPQSVRSFAPASEDGDREEVFESDIVQEIPASHVCGTVELFLGHHDRAAICDERSKTERSLVSVRAKYFYVHQHKRIQQLHCSGFAPESWLQRCNHRNLSLSAFCQELEGLHQEMATELYSDVALDVSDLLGSAAKVQRPLGHGILSSKVPGDRRRFFTNVEVRPNWASFADSNLLYHEHDQHQHWKIDLGDFIAVKDYDSLQGEHFYPFVDSWVPAQILAIYVDESAAEGSNHGNLLFQVRLLQMNDSPNGELPLVEAPFPSRIENICSNDLRGPLLVCPLEASFETKWKVNQKHLPCAPCWGSKSLFVELHTALKESTVYAPEDIIEVLAAACVDQTPRPIDTDGGLDGKSEQVDTGTAWTAAPPFHVDLSQLREYYSELKLIPQRQSYAVGVEDADYTRPWSVKMGEIVLVHCDGSKRYPMDCNWSVGEVVAIWKTFSSLDEMEKDRQVGGANGNGTPPVEVEIRWMYERHDFQGSGTLTLESSEEVEEVFESDHVDVIQGGDILRPATVRADPKMFVQNEKFLGIPVHKYICRRFWSTTRKSLIPCGNLEGRQNRGWLYSRNFPPEVQTKFSNLLMSPAATSNKSQTKMTWKEAMDRIIGKLSLQDASKGAYEKGETMIGREKELDQLLAFFRDAMRGTAGTGGSKSSLFLAGPPGVGKTACVRAAIARLRQEQAQGKVPTFKFISLNGMEMRHPFEAYGKFLEALTGCKHVGPHEVASAKLTDLFTSPRQPDVVDDDTVTVLLLDEIDYLITEKQTVLYDFFDWPKRAAELANGRRLVVVGISNTLNLAEQLLPSVQSRLGAENKCLFRSYNLKDTMNILKSKMKEASPDMKIFEDDAILLASKKTAGLSGDIRKAFQICRAAAHLVIRNWEADKDNRASQSEHPTVRISDVQKASLETFNITTLTAVSFCSSFQALLLISIASLRRTTGREGSFDIQDIMMKMDAVAGASGDPQYCAPPSFSETIQLLNNLAERDLIGLVTAKSTLISFRSSKGGSGGAWPLVSPKVDDLLVIKGLKNTAHKRLCDKILPSVY